MPLQISVDLYMQSTGITRLDIVRKIKANGGTITPPEKASIVLVNPDIKESRKSFFVWSTDEQKVVLNVQWVNHCLKKGRLLDADDDWGGLRITDLPGDDSGDEDEVEWEVSPQRDDPDAQIHLATHRTSPMTQNTQGESSNTIQTPSTKTVPPPPESLSPSSAATHTESPRPVFFLSEKARGKRPAAPQSSSSINCKVSSASQSSSSGILKGKAFWVQPDAKNRAEIVQLIKKHGGGIRPNMDEADYCILSPKSTTYKELYTRTLKAKKPPLGYTWLTECEKAKDILPPEHWLLEAHGRLVHPVTAARFASEDEDVVDGTSQGDNDSNAEYVSRSSTSEDISSRFTSNSKRTRDNMLMEEAMVQLFADEPDANSREIFERVRHLFDKKYGVAFLEMYYLSNLTRLQQDIARQRAVTRTNTRGTFPDAPASHYQRDHLLDVNQPLPKPPTKVETMGGGKNRFTKEEQDYLYDLCRYRFLRNPGLSKSALTTELVQKIPSHTTASWQRYLFRKDEEIDTIRKQAIRTREKFSDAFPSDSDSDERESPKKRRRKA